jgi:hypothetical protein
VELTHVLQTVRSLGQVTELLVALGQQLWCGITVFPRSLERIIVDRFARHTGRHLQRQAEEDHGGNSDRSDCCCHVSFGTLLQMECPRGRLKGRLVMMWLDLCSADSLGYF